MRTLLNFDKWWSDAHFENTLTCLINTEGPINGQNKNIDKADRVQHFLKKIMRSLFNRQVRDLASVPPLTTFAYPGLGKCTVFKDKFSYRFHTGAFIRCWWMWQSQNLQGWGQGCRGRGWGFRGGKRIGHWIHFCERGIQFKRPVRNGSTRYGIIRVWRGCRV